MRVVFIGTGDIGRPTLRFLLESKENVVVGVVTQPDRPAGRQLRVEPTPIKAALGAAAVPVFQPARIKHAEAIGEIGALAPDVIVVMAYGQILPRAVLEIPRIACLNLHASLLPRHRGAAPIQAAIVAGDGTTGITVMYMDEGLDTGDILLQSRIEINAEETGGSLHDRLGALAPAALSEALAQLRDGTARRMPQDPRSATSAPKLEREHGRIDFAESADAIERKIRAFDPWPGAFIVIGDDSGRQRKLKVFRARARRQTEGVEIEKLVVTNDGALSVAIADGALSFLEVQLEGKRRMSAEEFLRGNPWVKNARII